MSDLGELFDRNPLNYNDATDIPLIVTRMREHQVQVELAATAKPGAVPKPPKEKSQKTLDLLKDLGLT